MAGSATSYNDSFDRRMPVWVPSALLLIQLSANATGMAAYPATHMGDHGAILGSYLCAVPELAVRDFLEMSQQ